MNVVAFFSSALLFSLMLLAIRYFALKKPLNKNSDIEIVNKHDLFPALITFNGIGTRFLGEFRTTNGYYYVTYRFFCVGLPIFPLDCYVVSNAIGNKQDEYQIYGTAKSRTVEIIAVYLQWYGWLGVALNSIYVFYGLTQ